MLFWASPRSSTSGGQLENFFKSADALLDPESDPRRPLLSAVIGGSREVLGRSAILSGTGLSTVTHMWSSMISGFALSEDTMTQNIFTGFTELGEDDVKRTLTELLADEDATDAGRWLVGRPRFTASFVEDAVNKNLGVKDTLRVYLSRMTVPRDAPRQGERIESTPALALSKLAKKDAITTIAGRVVPTPVWRFLTDAYWVSFGGLPVTNEDAGLVEFGLGYAEKVSAPDYIESVVLEPLVLVSARLYRNTMDPTTVDLEKLKEVRNSKSALGERYEFLVAEKLLGTLLASLPADFRPTTWSLPEWRFGYYAVTDANDETQTRLDLYSWLEEAMDPANDDVLRVRFPSNSAGPDIIFVLRDATRTRVLPIFAQCKFRKEQTDRDVRSALRTVDPALLHHARRDTTRPTPIAGEVNAARRKLTADFLDRTPVVRVVTSGKARTARRGVRYVPRGTVRDVEVVLDEADNERMFGPQVARYLNSLGEA